MFGWYHLRVSYNVLHLNENPGVTRIACSCSVFIYYLVARLLVAMEFEYFCDRAIFYRQVSLLPLVHRSHPPFNGVRMLDEKSVITRIWIIPVTGFDSQGRELLGRFEFQPVSFSKKVYAPFLKAECADRNS